MNELLTPRELPVLTGKERFSCEKMTVADFWAWALGDLRMNTARGWLAEYLVATAVSSRAAVRLEWGPQDVTADDGTRIEVKTTGRLQSWAQKTLGEASFDLNLSDSSWDTATGTYVTDPRGRVDVWVFALQNCSDHALYDPLSIEQWTFWSLPHLSVKLCGRKRGRVALIEELGATPLRWSELASGIKRAAQKQKQLVRASA